METALSAHDRFLQDIARIQVNIAEMQRIERVRKDCEAIRAAAQPWARHLSLYETHKRAEELRNFWKNVIHSVTVKLPCTLNHVLHRVQGHAGGSKGKTSAKQKSSSSGGSSGGSDGDGDGPHRTSPKQKQRRLKESRTNSLTHPPSVPAGEIAPSQLPHPSLLHQHRNPVVSCLSLVGLFVLAFTADSHGSERLGMVLYTIFALCVTGNSDVVKQFLTSKLVPALIARLVSLYAKENDG